MGGFRAFHCRGRRWRVKQKFNESELVIEREADKIAFRDGPASGFLGGGDDKIANAATLQFGRAFHDRQRIWGEACFKARGACRCGWRSGILFHLPYCTAYNRTIQPVEETTLLGNMCRRTVNVSIFEPCLWCPEEAPKVV